MYVLTQLCVLHGGGCRNVLSGYCKVTDFSMYHHVYQHPPFLPFSPSPPPPINSYYKVMSSRAHKRPTCPEGVCKHGHITLTMHTVSLC
jgi:hypothetical protein